MYLDNLWNPVEYQGHRSKVKVKVTWVFVLVACMILLEPVGLDLRNVIRYVATLLLPTEMTVASGQYLL